MNIPLESKEIKGVTLKLVYLICGGIIGIVFTVTLCYANLKETIHDGNNLSVQNNTQLGMITKSIADDAKEKNARITTLELQQAEIRIEIKMLERKLGMDITQ